MKVVYTAVFLCLAHVLVGQDIDRGKFLMFVGVSVNASASTTMNVGDDVQGLTSAFSPGAEFGFRYTNAIIKDWPWFNINLGVGTNIVVVRNGFIVDNFLRIPGYESAQYIIAFLESGLSCGTSAFKKRLEIYGGYRLNVVGTTLVTYDNISQVIGSEYIYSSEVTVNPNNRLYHALVLRPEIVFNAKGGHRKFVLGIQGLVGSGGDGSGLTEGSYRFESSSISSVGELNGRIASLSIIVQMYL